MARNRGHSREYKLEAIRLWQSSHLSAAEVEEDLGLTRGSLYAWQRRLTRGGEQGNGDGDESRALISRLEQENRRLRQERNLLRRLLARFKQPAGTAVGRLNGRPGSVHR